MSNKKLDQISGLIFLIIGLLVAFGSWQMPRFEAQGAPAYQAPGLTPGLLGIALAICGLILAMRQKKGAAEDHSFWESVFGQPTNRKRAMMAIILTLIYGALLFGLVPFVLATFLFVFSFIYIFEQVLKPEGEQAQLSKIRTISIASIIAIVMSFGTYFVFQELFLIQLP